jgi:diguanylate cyclase (GGDEF)-like protein
MSIKKKTIFITAAMGLILLVSLNVIVRAVLLEKFDNLQNIASRINVVHILLTVTIVLIVTGFSFVINNIINKHEVTINHISNHDELTGMPNRQYFEEKLASAITRAGRGKKSFIAFFDIDDFKIINDHYGHNFGDKVLVDLSKHLSKNVRNTDTIARFGGDEFILLIEQDEINKAKIIAERLRVFIDQYNIDIDNINFKFRVSMGLVEIEPDETVNEILARADRAMYMAKENGKDQLVVLEREFNYSTTSELVVKLKGALSKKLFKVYYQPIIKLSTNEIAHYEALSRLEDSTGPTISPGVFIPVMERYGLIGELTRFVLKEVIQVLKENPEKCIYINLSGKSFPDQSILFFIIKSLSDSEINPRQLGFEVTETAMLNDIAQAKEWIFRLKKLGCRFAIDDFGSGFMSFNILKELPVDLFKLDGNVIKDIHKNPSNAAMIKSVRLLANLLGKETVAEWIENKEVDEMVKSLGVEYGQGFYYSKPGPNLVTSIMARKKSSKAADDNLSEDPADNI